MDTIELMGNSLIQHGKYNDRIYLIKLSEKDFPEILTKLDDIALSNKYSKIFCKVPSWAKSAFESEGYKQEAYIPNFFEGKNTVYFMSKYISDWRKVEKQSDKITEILEVSQKKESFDTEPILDSKFIFRTLMPSDAEKMVDVYKKVFETYPFPIHDENYIIKTMKENLVYFGVFDSNNLAAISSCEMDVHSKNVEMTDFASLKKYRGNGFASFLLYHMEIEMIQRGIKTFYTIARALSFGMNITFSKLDYKYTGTLINNTNISGGLESMNVWYKCID